MKKRAVLLLFLLVGVFSLLALSVNAQTCADYATATTCGQKTFDTCTATCIDGKAAYNCVASQNSNCKGTISCSSEDGRCCNTVTTIKTCGQNTYDTCTATCIDGKAAYNCVASQNNKCVGTIFCSSEDGGCCSSLATTTTCGQKTYDTCTPLCSYDSKRYYNCQSSKNSQCIGTIWCAAEDSQCTTCDTYATSTLCGQKTYDKCTGVCGSDGKKYYTCEASQNANCKGTVMCGAEDYQCAGSGTGGSECDAYKTQTVCGQKTYNACSPLCSSDGKRYYQCKASQDADCVGTIFCEAEDSQCTTCSIYATKTTCGQKSYDTCYPLCTWDGNRYYWCEASQSPASCRGTLMCAAENSQCSASGSRCGDGICESTKGETSSTCPSDCGLSNCGGTNGCSARGDTKCSNDIQQTCDDYGKKCLEWGGDQYCNYGCDTSAKKCKIGPGNTCNDGCQPYCLPWGVRIYGPWYESQTGKCEWWGPRDMRCTYSTQTCNDFNECTKNSCTPKSCIYTNEANSKSCYFTYPKKISENDFINSISENRGYVQTESGVDAFAWKREGYANGYFYNISATILQPNGTATQVLIEENTTAKVPKNAASVGSSVVYGPSISYSKADDSFLVVWGVTTRYSTVEDVTKQTMSWYNYSIFASRVKNNVAGNKQLVAANASKLLVTSHIGDSLFGNTYPLLYPPVVAYSSADNKFFVSWINIGQREELCYSSRTGFYSCGQYLQYAVLQGAVTNENGKPLNTTYFGKYEPSYYNYDQGQTVGVMEFILRNSPTIAASDDGKLLVLWTFGNYRYDSDKTRYYIDAYSTQGYLVDSKGSILNSGYYSRTYPNLAYETSQLGSPYFPPKHYLSYSPKEKEFAVGAIVYTQFSSTTNKPIYSAWYNIEVALLNTASGTEQKLYPYKNKDSVMFPDPQSLKLFRTADSNYIVFWKEYYYSFANINPLHVFVILEEPPVISNGQPKEKIATLSSVMSVQTDKAAKCRYSTRANREYSLMENVFSTTGSTLHSEPLTNLEDSRSYSYYVKCINEKGYENIEDYPISFIVSNSSPAVISDGKPTGTIYSLNAVLAVQTNKAATCKYASGTGISYTSMPYTFATTGTKSHRQALQQLSAGNYKYYVKCKDTAGRNNTQDYEIKFTVAPAWYVFITSTSYTGQLGYCNEEGCYGLGGADSKCWTQANAAGLSGSWKAWLSDDTTSAASRITHGTGPYKLLNGATIASNWTDLVDGTLLTNIYIDEFGKSAGGSAWTNTKADGTIYGKSAESCYNWASQYSNYVGRYGIAEYGTSGNGLWTSFANTSCDRTLKLYCLSENGMIQGSIDFPPVVSNGQPTGAITTTSPTLSVYTDIQALCKYDTRAGIPYDSMANNLSQSSSTYHAKQLSQGQQCIRSYYDEESGTNVCQEYRPIPLIDGSYTYYIKCAQAASQCIAWGEDGDGNWYCTKSEATLGEKNTDDYAVSFKIDTNIVPMQTNTLQTIYARESQTEYSPEQNKLGVMSTYSSNGLEYNPYYYYTVTYKNLLLYSLDTKIGATYDAPGYGLLVMGSNYTKIFYAAYTNPTTTVFTDYKPGLMCGNGKCGAACPSGSSFDSSCDGASQNTCSATGSFCTGDGCAAQKNDSDEDGFDNRCDLFPDNPCAVIAEFDNCNNKKGAKCPACIMGNVTNVSGAPVSDALIQVLGTNYNALTNADGSYRIAPSAPGFFTLSASKKDRFTPTILQNTEVYAERITVINFTLGSGSSLCEPDCTYSSDELCHSSCEGTNGCSFYDLKAVSICDNQHIGFRLPYDGNEVQCCTGAPYSPSRIKATTEINASNVVRIVKEAFYEGKLVKIVIDVFD